MRKIFQIGPKYCALIGCEVSRSVKMNFNATIAIFAMRTRIYVRLGTESNPLFKREERYRTNDFRSLDLILLNPHPNYPE